MSRFPDSYAARTLVADALAWLHDEDGWTWDDVRSLCDDEIDQLIEDEENEAS